jgi:hypothetical protein
MNLNVIFTKPMVLIGGGGGHAINIQSRRTIYNQQNFFMHNNVGDKIESSSHQKITGTILNYVS